jgi:hypothetical protein
MHIRHVGGGEGLDGGEDYKLIVPANSTVPGKKFFLIFRFCGSEPAFFDKSWKLNDVEKLK